MSDSPSRPPGAMSGKKETTLQPPPPVSVDNNRWMCRFLTPSRQVPRMIRQEQHLVRTGYCSVGSLSGADSELCECYAGLPSACLHPRARRRPRAEAEPAEALAGAVLRSNDGPFSASHQLPVLLTRTVRRHLW